MRISDWSSDVCSSDLQNYRSSGNILAAANALISNNSGRLGKNLWTSGEQGDAVKVYAAFNARDEADFVINRIRAYVMKGGLRSEQRRVGTECVRTCKSRWKP